MFRFLFCCFVSLFFLCILCFAVSSSWCGFCELPFFFSFDFLGFFPSSLISILYVFFSFVFFFFCGVLCAIVFFSFFVYFLWVFYFIFFYLFF